MLSDEQFLSYIHRYGLSDEAIGLIQFIRNSPPARNVQSRHGNVCVRFPSRKMGMTIQAESHTVELPAIYMMEHDADTFEFYDQPPPPIKFQYKDKKGRNRGYNTVQDFFVIRSNWIGWEQWKTESDLRRKAEEQPGVFELKDGLWRCLPGERFAEKYGLFFAVRSDVEINWILQNNFIFLDDYYDSTAADLRPEVLRAVKSFFFENNYAYLADLLNPGNGVNADDIYKLIAHQDICCDLDVDDIRVPTEFRVYRDETSRVAYQAYISSRKANSSIDVQSLQIRTGSAFRWDGKVWQILNLGETNLVAKDDGGQIIELPRAFFLSMAQEGKIERGPDQEFDEASKIAEDILLTARSADLEAANRRSEIVHTFLAGESCSTFGVSQATIYRYVSAWQMAKKTFGNGYVGLIPNVKDRGNRKTKISEQARAIMEEGINNYEDLRHGNMAKAYGDIKDKCDLLGIQSPSYRAVVNAIHNRPKQQQVMRREGHRSAYLHTEFYWELTRKTPRHGSRPFEICHIDHTEVDLELISSRNGKNLGRPWLTLLIDAYTRRILAFYFTFDPPSYRSCMMTLRECVRCHGRLPQTIVVDNGSDFRSVYFDSVLARFQIAKKLRPTGKVRFGTVVERMFGVSNSELFHNLLGNTQVMRDPRTVTKSINPKNLAVWTLPRLHELFQKWTSENYELSIHPALGISPRDAFDAAIATTGARLHKMIPYKEEFKIFTCPTTPKGIALVSATRGVKIHYIYYWSTEFRNPKIAGTSVPVRYDPYNVAIAYAYVNGRWVTCRSNHYTEFLGRTEREINILAQEYRKQRSNHNREWYITEAKLARLLREARSEELELQRMRDHDVKAAHEDLMVHLDLDKDRRPVEIDLIKDDETAKLEGHVQSPDSLGVDCECSVTHRAPKILDLE